MKQKEILKIKDKTDWTLKNNRKRRRKGWSNGKKPLAVARVFDKVTVAVEMETHQKKYKCGTMGDAIKTLNVKIDLGKMKFPWQPHTCQAEEFANVFAEAIMENYQFMCQEMAGQ